MSKSEDKPTRAIYEAAARQAEKGGTPNFDTTGGLFDAVRFVIESNAIEGYEGRSYQAGSPYFEDHLDAYYHAVNEIRERGMTRDLILSGHGILTKELLPPSGSGKFRDRQVYVGSYVCPHSNRIERLVENFVQHCRSGVESIHDCWDAHFWFESIHPFIDGNGRWGRCLLNAMLLFHGHLPIVIEHQRRFAYYDAIETWRRANWQRILADALG